MRRVHGLALRCDWCRINRLFLNMEHAGEKRPQAIIKISLQRAGFSWRCLEAPRLPGVQQLPLFTIRDSPGQAITNAAAGLSGHGSTSRPLVVGMEAATARRVVTRQHFGSRDRRTHRSRGHVSARCQQWYVLGCLFCHRSGCSQTCRLSLDVVSALRCFSWILGNDS